MYNSYREDRQRYKLQSQKKSGFLSSKNPIGAPIRKERGTLAIMAWE